MTREIASLTHVPSFRRVRESARCGPHLSSSLGIRVFEIDRAKRTLCELGCEERWAGTVAAVLIVSILGRRQSKQAKGDGVVAILNDAVSGALMETNSLGTGARPVAVPRIHGTLIRIPARRSRSTRSRCSLAGRGNGRSA